MPATATRRKGLADFIITAETKAGPHGSEWAPRLDDYLRPGRNRPMEAAIQDWETP